MRRLALLTVTCLAASAASILPAGASDYIERAGQGRFDATGDVKCAHGKGHDMKACPFGVARGMGSDAAVVVTMPDGRKRTIFFEAGTPRGADASQADGGGEVHSRKEGDMILIRIGEERYEMPEAVVFGG